MNNLDSVIPYDQGPELAKRLRERDGPDAEDRARKRPRADTISILEKEGKGKDIVTPPQAEPDLAKYNRKRLHEGLQFLHNESKKKVTPRTIEFLHLHKDAYKVALEKETLEEPSLAVVQALDRVYFSAAFYFKARSSDEQKAFMYYVNLRRLELLANYGDYLGQELQEIRAKLKAIAVNAGAEIKQATAALGPPQTWVQIADQLEGADMKTSRSHVSIACHILGLDSNHVDWLIKEWAERNRRFHNSMREHITNCEWLSLAQQMCRDLTEIRNVESNPESAAKYEIVIRSIMNEYFEVLDDTDAVSWLPNAKAAELTKKSAGPLTDFILKFPPLVFSKAKIYLIVMLTFSALTLFVTLRFLIISVVPASQVEAAPFNASANGSTTPTSPYWLSHIHRRGTVAFGDTKFQIFRNVKNYGAVGDGKADDTTAINKAISDGQRCGQGCDSATTSPALVYFPPGTYLVSKPIVQLYYTQLVGDAITLPTIKAASTFQGIAVIDSDPYLNGGDSQYTNQNNFFRQVRNFVIDITAMPPISGTGVHWQVAQATSLQNIRFEMSKGGGAGNKQQGIFMDNGSGGFMTDLIFNGGRFGAFLGNQQFTTRNLTFNHVQTAIYMNWNWLWAFKSLSINDCGVGINMSTGPVLSNGGINQTVGSILVQDSKFARTPQGIVTSFGHGNVPVNGGTLVIDNVDFTDSNSAVVDQKGKTILAGGSKIASWAQGTSYRCTNSASANSTICGITNSTAGNNFQGRLPAMKKPTSLLNAQGAVVERSKPQYERLPASSFISVKSKGAKGDGITDDTAAIQAIFDVASTEEVVYFDHGAYIISKTIKVPKNIRITGEIWPLIMASGTAFSNQDKPAPVFQVGQPGDAGCVEMSDLIFETVGPQPGAVLVEWNVAEPAGEQASSGLWDVHFRIGGTSGTKLQSDKCAKSPNVTSAAKKNCEGAFLLLHVTTKSSIYVENCWFWVADHELDLKDHSQIDVYNGRGVLIESHGPVWMYGTSSEHSQLYNYQISHAKNIYMSSIQTETPYMQSNHNTLAPYTPKSTFSDPTFDTCTTASCRKSWGLRVVDSSDIHIYGAGLYSFFDNYKTSCLVTESCQENIVSVERSAGIHIYGLSTKASSNMVTVNHEAMVPQKDNRNNFCSTVAHVGLD